MAPAKRSVSSMGRFAAALLLAACGMVHADGDVTPSPSAAERCLVPADAEHARPIYPVDMFKIRRGGFVEARFTFSAPDRAPDVTIVQASEGAFEGAVRAYAAGLRVPCLGEGDRPVAIAQYFDFVPNDGRKVAYTAPVDLAAADRKASQACLVKPSANLPDYPMAPLRQGMEGTVVLRLHFTDPSKAPAIELLDNGGSAQFASAVQAFVEGFRLPCVGEQPVDLDFRFSFQIEGSGIKRVALRDMPLNTFLKSVKQVPADSVYFDTTLMKCPFDVRLTFEQPWSRNRIDELEEDVPARHAFLDWLGGMQLDLGPRVSNHVLGQSMVIHVPCVKIDL